MKQRFLTEREIESGGFMPTSVARAKRLIVTVAYRTVRHVAYDVVDPLTGSKHLVLYKFEKKPPLDWVCDCEWYSTKAVNDGKYCAHILAVHLNKSKLL